MKQKKTYRETFSKGSLFNGVNQRKDDESPCNPKGLAPFMGVCLIKRTALAVREKREGLKGLKF